ncbi:5-methylcytosine-specific restriction endonuclease system specificity protein McrC [Arcicella aquatica]|uniref:5-methylcytosine-specific restriction endonuclease system specificity protein McrC n=1 Tax=Arcicella aquatica TaxID=217141 RepID=A0ABU5QIZ2_9BACT|nr:5-methylcytosine-specific restriction endonuclease system specificity protein McrC [Arcicella aquatica]MEA5257027.1 5-methylcytosine-specific restriction endonuclease system specificity protein McrC [Arcicella aquatica]
MIPIENIYYLLCYAWNRLEEKELINVSTIEVTDLPNLLARVLLKGTKLLINRGLDKQYIAEQNLYQGIKGRVDFNYSFRKNLFQQGLAMCEFDELSVNILSNQVLKTSLQHVIKLPTLDRKLKREIQTVLYHLADIDTITISNDTFARVQINRHNQYYLFLLNICELLHHNLLIHEKTGEVKFKDFLRDERQMARLFEEFVRNFYKIEVPEARVFREDLHWQFTGEQMQFLPKMQTDISVKLPSDRKIIIDAKYYSETLQHFYDAEKIHSRNLYQMFAYLKNQPNLQAEGILLYPTVQKSLSLSYTYEGHQIRVETLNLNQSWMEIKNDLLKILDKKQDELEPHAT